MSFITIELRRQCDRTVPRNCDALTRKNSSLCFNRWEFLVIVVSSWNANACVSFSSCWWTTKTISLILSIFLKYWHQRKTPFAKSHSPTNSHIFRFVQKIFFAKYFFIFFVKIVFCRIIFFKGGGAIKKRKRPPVRIRLSLSHFIILGVTSPFLAKTNKFIQFRMCATPFNYPSFSYVTDSTIFS